MVAQSPQFKLQLPPVFEYQRQALFGQERYAIVEGSTKVGKTFPCLIWILEMMGRFAGPNHNFWWVAPTSAQAMIAYSRTKQMLLLADPSKTIWSAVESPQPKITIHGCGHLWFKTGEKPDNLYGEDVYAAVMDEYTRMRPEAWFALRSTLTATGGLCRFIGNVKGRKNWGYLWARKAQAGEPNMSYAKLTCWDAVEAGIMSREEVEQAQRDLPEAVFKELYLAEPSEDGSNPFGITSIAACVEDIHKDCEPVAWGWDLARAHDWTVGIGLCEHGCVCRCERWNQTSMPRVARHQVDGDSHHDYWAVTLKRIRDLTGHTPALVDSTGPGGPIDQALSADGHFNIEGYVFTNRSKQMLMEGLAVVIQGADIGIPEGPIRMELESFEYVASRTGVQYSAPEGSHDDCVCALALAVECARRVKAGSVRASVFPNDALKEYYERIARMAPPLTGTLTHEHAPGREQDLSIADGRVDHIGFSQAKDGPVKLWCPLHRGRPPRHDRYMLFAVAGEGTAGVIVVAEANRKGVVGQLVRVCAADRLARAAVMLSMWFGEADNPAPVGYIANTPAGTVFGQHLHRLGGTGHPWEPDPREFAEALGLLRAAWDGGHLVERDPEVFATCRQYVHSGTTVMHASLLGAPERRAGHADLVMARAGLWRMLAGVVADPTEPREPQPGSAEYRFREHHARERAEGEVHFG